MRGNRFASLSHKRTLRNDRLEHDEYETPPDVVKLLTDHVKFTGPILDPACGSMRLLNAVVLQTNLLCEGTDIALNIDYLAESRQWPGDVITNPPYHKGMADAFVSRALATTSGKVAMLLQADFMFGSDRSKCLHQHFPPEVVIAVPWRIRFFIGASDERISSQAYNHCWFVWNNRLMQRPETKLILPY